MPYIDSLLNRITMYRLLLWGLGALAAYAFFISLIGQLSYSVLSMFISLAVLLAACFGSNYAFSKLFRAPTNIESSWITALILFFTLAPFSGFTDAALLAAAGIVAMGSKYILAIKKRHIFNPAAFALLTLSVSGSGLAIWWVGTPWMLPATAILGLLVVRKIRRFDTLLPFLAVSIAVAVLYAVLQQASVMDTLRVLLLSWPLVFFGTIMLVEPLTMPPSRGLRVVYAVLVGGLFSAQFHLGPIYATPELALVAGNLYAFFVGSRQRLLLTLRAIEHMSPGVYEFVFAPSERLVFAAGQYLEWTLPHKNADSRGNRRYFTVASSPASPEIRLGARISDHPSSFKRALMALEEGGTLSATSLAGDFTLPRDASHPLVFIAGGIGITPFASMLRYLLDTKEKRSIVLLYGANTPNDFAYRSVIAEAEAAFGMHTSLLAGERMTEATIQAHVPELKKPFFYLSGPDAMVRSYKKILRGLGVPAAHIKTDYFPGL